MFVMFPNFSADLEAMFKGDRKATSRFYLHFMQGEATDAQLEAVKAKVDTALAGRTEFKMPARERESKDISVATVDVVGIASALKATMFHLGIGEAKNCEAAIEWYAKGIALKNTDAMVGRGLMHLHGDGESTGEPNYADAKKCFQDAIVRNNSRAMIFKAEIYLTALIKEGAEQPLALLGEEEAFLLVDRAFKQDEPRAITWRGVLLEERFAGESDSRSLEQATQLYVKAIEMGEAFAMQRMGRVHANGFTKARSSAAEAGKYYLEALRRKDFASAYELGQLVDADQYKFELSQTKPAAFRELHFEAAKSGMPSGMYHFALLLRQEGNDAEAAEWLRRVRVEVRLKEDTPEVDTILKEYAGTTNTRAKYHALLALNDTTNFEELLRSDTLSVFSYLLHDSLPLARRLSYINRAVDVLLAKTPPTETWFNRSNSANVLAKNYLLRFIQASVSNPEKLTALTADKDEFVVPAAVVLTTAAATLFEGFELLSALLCPPKKTRDPWIDWIINSPLQTSATTGNIQWLLDVINSPVLQGPNGPKCTLVLLDYICAQKISQDARAVCSNLMRTIHRDLIETNTPQSFAEIPVSQYTKLSCESLLELGNGLLRHHKYEAAMPAFVAAWLVYGNPDAGRRIYQHMKLYDRELPSDAKADAKEVDALVVTYCTQNPRVKTAIADKVVKPEKAGASVQDFINRSSKTLSKKSSSAGDLTGSTTPRSAPILIRHGSATPDDSLWGDGGMRQRLIAKSQSI